MLKKKKVLKNLWIIALFLGVAMAFTGCIDSDAPPITGDPPVKEENFLMVTTRSANWHSVDIKTSTQITTGTTHTLYVEGWIGAGRTIEVSAGNVPALEANGQGWGNAVSADADGNFVIEKDIPATADSLSSPRLDTNVRVGAVAAAVKYYYIYEIILTEKASGTVVYQLTKDPDIQNTPTVSEPKLQEGASGTTWLAGALGGTSPNAELKIIVPNSFVAVEDVVAGFLPIQPINRDIVISGVVGPEDAENTDIVWTVKSGSATLTGGKLKATAAGPVVLTATIADGKAVGTNFTKDFTITFVDGKIEDGIADSLVPAIEPTEGYEILWQLPDSYTSLSSPLQGEGTGAGANDAKIDVVANGINVDLGAANWRGLRINVGAGYFNPQEYAYKLTVSGILIANMDTIGLRTGGGQGIGDAIPTVADGIFKIVYNIPRDFKDSEVRVGIPGVTINAEETNRPKYRVTDIVFEISEDELALEPATDRAISLDAPIGSPGILSQATTDDFQYTGAVVWWNATDGKAQDPGTSFIVGKAYTAIITLTPKDRWSFSDVSAKSVFTVGGATSTSTAVVGGKVVVTAVFPATVALAPFDLTDFSESKKINGWGDSYDAATNTWTLGNNWQHVRFGIGKVVNGNMYPEIVVHGSTSGDFRFTFFLGGTQVEQYYQSQFNGTYSPVVPAGNFDSFSFEAKDTGSVDFVITKVEFKVAP